MPNKTFFNLSDEKRRRIVDAALQEFAAHSFNEASINRIIKNADIPKGSFYQYFKNKEDLYLYFLDEVSKKFTDPLLHEKEMHPDANFFEVIKHVNREVLKIKNIRPEYIEIRMRMELDNNEFIMNIRKKSTEKYIKIIEHDKERGIINPDVDAKIIVDMIASFSLNEFYRNGSSAEEYLRKLDSMLNIIKEGVAVARDK
ncbi:MAG TPA: TetR/AcrR family transcriptional regulator [Ktedonobacteraceae bacterium]|nr:TetR/AcrR family transcriptional regulator [Ktedonobacteraceae bacterium]